MPIGINTIWKTCTLAISCKARRTFTATTRASTAINAINPGTSTVTLSCLGTRATATTRTKWITTTTWIAGVAWSGCNVSTVAAGSWASDTGFYFADSSLTEETAVIAYPFAGQEGTSDEADLTAYLSDSGIDNITSTDGIFYVEVFEFSDASSNYDEAPNAVDNIINTGTLTILYVPGDTPQPVCGNGVVEDGEECDDGNNTPNDGCTNCTNDPEPPCAGDFDDDGSVGLSDFSSFLVAFGTTCSGCVEDIDGSGTVDLADFSAFLVVFGTDCP